MQERGRHWVNAGPAEVGSTGENGGLRVSWNSCSGGLKSAMPRGSWRERVAGPVHARLCRWFPGQLALLMCLVAVTVSAPVESRLPITTGEELVQYVDAFGVTGADSLLVLQSPGMIRMANLTFPTPEQLARNSSVLNRAPFSSGLLVIRSSGTDPAAMVLNADMRADLTPQFEAAKLVLEGFTLVNLCEKVLPWDALMGTYYISSITLALFNSSRIYQSHTTLNMVYTARAADIAVLVYMQAAQRTTFPQIQAALVPLLNIVPPLQANISYITSSSARFAFISRPSSRHNNFTLRAVEDLSDPLLHSLHAQGLLMTPQFCNGTVLPPDLRDTDVDAMMGPFLFATNTSEWTAKLPRLVQLAEASQHQWRPPPALLLSGQASLTGVELQGAPFAMHAMALITGAFNDVPEYAVRSVLDLGDHAGVLEQAANSSLFFARLTLRGLAVQPLEHPAVLGVPPSSAPSSALGLSFVKRNDTTDWLSDPQIWMHNVTLELPTLDYLALAEIAHRDTPMSISACVGDDVRAHVAALEPGITVTFLFGTDHDDLDEPPPMSPFGPPPDGRGPHLLDGFPVSNYMAWGVNATQMFFAPLEPTDPAIRRVQQCVEGAHVPSHSLSGGAVAGIVVASVLGLTALVGASWWGARRAGWGPCARPQQLLPVAEPPPSKTKSASPQRSVRTSATQSSQPSDSESGRSHPPDDPGVASGAGVTSALQLMVKAAAEHQAATSQAALVQAGMAGEDADGVEEQPSTASSAGQHNLSDQHMVTEDSAVGTTPEHASMVQCSTQPTPSLPTATSARSRGGRSGARGDVAEGMAGHQYKQAVRVRASELGGDSANRVCVTGMLGRGSWGTVFSGVWRGLPVALKTMVFELPPHTPEQPAQSSRAIMEAAIAASIGHRNVVCTYYYDILPVHASHEGFLGGLQISFPPGGPTPSDEKETYKLFLVQELCSVTLAMALEAGALHNRHTQRAEERPILNLLLDIARGLEYLHSKGIIHGDLKPANVLLKAEGHSAIGVVAKLADFGLSTSMEPGLTHVSNYQGGAPFYVAPEVVHEYRTSSASDIWSLGVIMWQLYSGKPPYLVQDGQYRGNPDFPNFSEPRVPGQAYSLLTHKCLQRDPKLRPAASELVLILTHLLPPPCPTPR